MAKKGFEEKLDELEDWKRSKEIEDGIRKGLTRWAHTICISATSTALAVATWLGSFAYEKWEPLKAAVKAYISASKP